MGAHRAHLLLLWRGFVRLTLQSLHPQPGLKGSQLRVLRGTGVPSGSEARSTGDSGGAPVELDFSGTAVRSSGSQETLR